jgi:hypothetical protein
MSMSTPLSTNLLDAAVTDAQAPPSVPPSPSALIDAVSSPQRAMKQSESSSSTTPAKAANYETQAVKASAKKSSAFSNFITNGIDTDDDDAAVAEKENENAKIDAKKTVGETMASKKKRKQLAATTQKAKTKTVRKKSGDGDERVWRYPTAVDGHLVQQQRNPKNKRDGVTTAMRLQVSLHDLPRLVQSHSLLSILLFLAFVTNHLLFNSFVRSSLHLLFDSFVRSSLHLLFDSFSFVRSFFTLAVSSPSLECTTARRSLYAAVAAVVAAAAVKAAVVITAAAATVARSRFSTSGRQN